MKACTNPNCKQINPQLLTEFYRSKGNKDGLFSRCKACTNLANRAYLQTPERKTANVLYKKEYQQTPERKTYRKRYSQTPEGKAIQTRANKKRWSTPEGKAKKLQANKKYRQSSEGKAKLNALTVKRQAKKLQRTPPWLTKEQHKENAEFYSIVQEIQWLGSPLDPLEVDHIVPLQGENVSGLHVPWNLQIIPQSLNGIKSNTFDSVEYNKVYFPEFCEG